MLDRKGKVIRHWEEVITGCLKRIRVEGSEFGT